MSVNKVILIGHVGKDPEVRHMESDLVKASFTLATSENYTNKNGEKVENTEWHNIVCWNQTATLAENYIRKGKELYIEGRIRTRSYDGQDGTKKYITEINADTIKFIGKKESNQPEGSKIQTTASSVKEPQSDAGSYSNNGNTDDDLPF
jgi:single-strand DNA-binding protein